MGTRTDKTTKEREKSFHPLNRASDKGAFCWLGMRLSQAWDWVDKRDIDKHFISVVIMSGTWRLTDWAMSFASKSDGSGVEIAAIIAAVTAPYMALQAAALKFYFDSRRK